MWCPAPCLHMAYITSESPPGKPFSLFLFCWVLSILQTSSLFVTLFSPFHRPSSLPIENFHSFPYLVTENFLVSTYSVPSPDLGITVNKTDFTTQMLYRHPLDSTYFYSIYLVLKLPVFVGLFCKGPASKFFRLWRHIVSVVVQKQPETICKQTGATVF